MEILLFIAGVGNSPAPAAAVGIVTIFAAIYCKIYSKTIIFTASLATFRWLSVQNVQLESTKANVQ